MKNYEYIYWKNEYSTPIEIINEGNKQFVKTYNHLLDSINNKTCPDEVIQILYSLLHYTEHHLINEEMLYNKHSSFKQHKNDHTKFVNKIKETITTYESGHHNYICEDLLKFMMNWFENHILKQDIEVIRTY